MTTDQLALTKNCTPFGLLVLADYLEEQGDSYHAREFRLGMIQESAELGRIMHQVGAIYAGEGNGMGHGESGMLNGDGGITNNLYNGTWGNGDGCGCGPSLTNVVNNDGWIEGGYGDRNGDGETSGTL